MEHKKKTPSKPKKRVVRAVVYRGKLVCVIGEKHTLCDVYLGIDGNGYDDRKCKIVNAEITYTL